MGKKLFFRTAEDTYREIASYPEDMSDEEVFKNARNDICEFCISRKFRISYLRVWNNFFAAFRGISQTLLDVGSKTENFVIEPAIDERVFSC